MLSGWLQDNTGCAAFEHCLPLLTDDLCWPSLQAAVPHTPIVLGRAALRKLRPSEVLVRRWPNAALPVQWFRLLDEDQPVVLGPCGHFFEAEEYEMVSGGTEAQIKVAEWHTMITVPWQLPMGPTYQPTSLQNLE